MGRLTNKVALITGAASGIGQAIASTFAAEDCGVILGDIQHEKGRAVAERLGAKARYIELDVTTEAEWRNAVDKIVAEFGRLDILVNNAGAISGVQRMDKETPEAYERIVRLNVTGVWNGIRAVIPPMKVQGSGSIINIASMDGLIGVAGMTTYVATKFAVTGMTKSAALELGDMGIRVNSIHPGIINTPGVAALTAEVKRQMEKAVAYQPIKRLGHPEEVALATLFFASDESTYCTGSMLVVDGGHIAGRYRDLRD